jgi:iron complex outermembrane receptor protein
VGRLGYVMSGGELRYDGYRAFSDARNTHANGVATYRAGGATTQLVLNTVRYHARNPGSLTDSAQRVDPRQAFANNVAHLTGEVGQQTQSGVRLAAPVTGGIAELSVYVLHRGIDNPIPPSIILLSRNAAGARATYTASWAPGTWRLSWIAGVESDMQRDDRQNYANQAGARGAITLNQRERVQTLAPFTEWRANYGAFGAVGGLRADYYRFRVADRLITPDDPDDSGRRTMRAVSPSFGVTYAIPSATLYANVATAFQTPTTTELANRPDGAGGFNPTVQPEHTHSQEVGISGMILGRATYRGAFYHQRTTDALVPFEVATMPGRTFFRNLGATQQYGAEVEASVAWSMATIRATYTYTDARVERDSAAIDGNRVPGIAPHLATLTIDAGSARRFAALELRAQSSMSVDDANTHHAAGYVVATLRGQWTMWRNMALFGGVGNLFGTRYDASVVVNAAGGRYYEPAAGRTIYAGMSWKQNE